MTQKPDSQSTKFSIRPRWQKVISDLWDSKTRTLLVVISIAIGVFAIGMISGAYVIIQEDMSSSYAAANPANIQFSTSSISQDLVDVISKEPGVKDAEGRRAFSVRARIPGEDWKSIDMIAIQDFNKIKLNFPSLLDGKLTPTKREVILESGALADLPVKISSLLEFELPDGTIRGLTVAGIVRDQTSSAGDFLASPLAYIKMDTLPWLKQTNAYNRLYLTVSDFPNSESYIRDIANNASAKIEKNGQSVLRTRISLRNRHPMASTVEAILGVLGALGVLILFLSSSLIANTINALLTQHIRYIGIMKLIGANTRQIFGMYFLMILVYSLIALSISIPAGIQAAYLFSMFIADQLNFTILGFRIIPVSIAIQTTVGVVIPLAAGLLPIINGAKVSVIKAIGGDTIGEKPKTSSEEKSASGSFRFPDINRLFSFFPRPIILSLRNTFRKKSRLALTLFTLTMGGAIFIAVFNVSTTLRQFIDQVGHYFLADVTMSFNRYYRLDEIYTTAKQVPGVERIEGWAYASGEILYPDGTSADNIVILAPPSASELVDPILIAGRWIIPGDQKAITISEAIWKRFPDLQPGDSLRAKINGQTSDWKVVGIFKFVDREGLIGYSNYEYIANLLNYPRQSASFRVVISDHKKANQELMSSQLDRYFRSKGYLVGQIEPGFASLKTASEGLDVLVTFLLIMAILTASVGSMGLAGTMGMNVMERTREIGIMRSIGAVDFEVFKNVVVEGVLIGLISWVLGAVLSFPISAGLSYIISIAIFNTPLTPSFTITGFVIWLALVLFLSAIASILPARTATRLTIREVLSYE